MRANPGALQVLIMLPMLFANMLLAPAKADEESGGAGPAVLPTTIIVNAKAWTGIDDPAEVQAIAITGDRISAIGANEQIKALAAEATQVIDARGRRVVPGITDSHTHLIQTGLQLSRLDLRNAANRNEFTTAVGAAANKLGAGRWVLGGQYTVESWDDPSPPRKEWIDAVTPGNPVFLTRTDLHQALANSVALKYARIDRNGPADPPGGEIERDPDTNEPTGILKDAAMELVSRHIPEPSKSDRYEALQLASRALNAWGITAIHDMTDPEDYEIIMAAHERGDLTIRIHSFFMTENFRDHWSRLQAINSSSDDMFRVAGYKAFMDGSLGSRTAYMHEPYSDIDAAEKYPRGMRSGHATDLEKFAAELRWANDQGVQLAVHAIGDEANHELLDIYSTLPGVQARRHRIEHAQHLLPDDIQRFAKLNVIASMQPFHKADDGRWAESVIGAERAQTMYAFKSLLDSGAVLCLGSDTPVAPANPFAAIAAATSGRTLDGKVWIPEQNISRQQALRCYTATPAYGAFQERLLGTIEPGKLADLAILNADVLGEPVDTLDRIESWVTIVDGRIVWRDEQASNPTTATREE